MILANNLIQPFSGNSITLDNSYLLNYIPFGNTTIETIGVEENCTTTFCRIVSIDFTNFNITTIPESFNQFIMLKSLVLKNNNIEELPLELYDLIYLEHLDLSINQIEELEYSLGSFTNLNYLNISSNNLSELPESLTLLPLLSYLDVSLNNLLEFNFYNLPNIETLFLGGNSISELNQLFCDLNINWSNYGNIVTDNYLCSNIPTCLSETNTVGSQFCNENQKELLQSIINQNGLNEDSSINDYDNNDSEFIPIELGYQRWELGQIVELNLSSNPNNNMEYGYEISFFPNDLSQFTSLEYLDLGNNQLTNIPIDIGLLTELISLKFDNNFISGNLTDGGVPNEIGQLSNLKILSIANNYLTIPNPAIYNLNSLEELYLNNNEIYYIDNEIGSLVELKILKLNNNDISTIPNEIRFLDGLVEFNASHNELISFNTNFRYLNQLRNLDLGNNFIQEIPTSISQMLNLREIKLNNNQLTLIPEEIFNLYHLKNLHLQYNSLISFDHDFSNSPHLEELKLHYNQLHELPGSICSIDIDFNQDANQINNLITLQQNYFCFNLPYCIENHENTQELIGEQDCYGSDIQVLDELMELNQISGSPSNLGVWENDRLVELNLSNQNISTLPNNLGYLAELKYLNLSNNIISEIPETIGYLNQLDSLDFSNNLMQNLPSQFDGLTELKILDLSYNSLIEYPVVINDLASLTSLDLSYNILLEIPSSINELINIRRLSLSGNSLTAIPSEIGDLNLLNELNISFNNLLVLPEDISNLSELTIFSLENNELDSIPPVFNHLHNLKNLNLSNNNIVELQENFFVNSSLENLNLSHNKLLRLPESICSDNNINIDLNDNYLYCVLGLENNQYFGYMDEVMIPDCIDNNININGLIPSSQGCSYYGCTADQGSPKGEALNYDEMAIMSCSSDGSYDNLNDCCLYVEGPDIFVRPIDSVINPGSDVSGDGSFENPFASIDKAVRLAGYRDRVIVDVGEYYESINIENKSAVSIVSNSIFESDVNLQNYYMENTIINGNNFESCFNISNSGDTSEIEISGLTIKNGRNDFGGGLKINNSNVLLDNVILTENTGTINGGALFIGGLSDVKIYNSLIDTNLSVTGTGFGGGLYAENNSSIYIKNTEISRNKSNSGGGIYLNNNNKVTFEKCNINNNIAINDGGGFFNTNDSLEFLHYINDINGQQDTILTYIEENKSRNGAGIYQLNNHSSIEGVVINKNNAEERGGGLYLFSPNFANQINNLIVTQNTAELGSGVYISNSNLKFYHMTFYDNLSVNSNMIYIGENSQVDIYNSILWNNNDDNIIYTPESSNLDIHHSILSFEFNGNHNQFLSPEFSDLNNFNLSRVSSALGMGINNQNIPLTDIYGNNRIMSTELEQDSNPDIGATEFYLGSMQFYNWFVSNNGNNSSTGLTTDEPKASINNTINSALNGDRIYIKNGIYNENIIFNGKNIKLMNYKYYTLNSTECNYINYETIEDVIIRGINNFPVIQILDNDDNVEICGFTIKDGESNNGAGILISNSNPKISNLIIKDNYSQLNGGGIFGDNFNGELNNIEITGNISAGNGGGIYLVNSSPIMKDIIISENTNRVGNYDLDGAGMYLIDSYLVNFESIKIFNNYASSQGGGIYLINSVIENIVELKLESNSSNQSGGGIYSLNSEITFNGTFISDIFNNSSNQDGGGIYLKSGNINGSYINISENNSNKDGGGIYIDDGGIIKLVDSDIINNSASEDGGAISVNGYDTKLILEYCNISNNTSETSSILYANNGDVKIKNSLVEGNNSFNYPGGILAKNSNISLLNVTLTNNRVVQPGAGGNINIEQFGTFNIINSILWNNDGIGIYLRDDGYSKSILATHSAFNNGRNGIHSSPSDSVYYYNEFNISSDPKFISPNEGFYYITKESPCVDTGISLYPPNANSFNDTILYIPQTDIVDGDGDGIAKPDMGTYDKRVLSVFPGDINNDGIVNIDDIINVITYFNFNGIPRYSKGINWTQEGHGAIAWDNQNNITGSTLTYSDANGDGIINERDILAIGLNWENEHTVIEPMEITNPNQDQLLQNHTDVLKLIYNSISGEGEGFLQIKQYLEKILNISSVPKIFSLNNNYPNPFNPTTEISFSLPEKKTITLSIYNLKGQLIQNLIFNKKYDIGHHKIQYNASSLSSGIYFYKIKSGEWEETKKMTVSK